MADDELVPASSDVQTLPLRSGHSVVVSDSGGEQAVSVRSPDGNVMVSVRFTEAGPVMELSAPSVQIASPGEVAVKCARFSVQAQEASIQVAGDLTEEILGKATRTVGGLCTTSAHAISVDARRGGIDITANDDVDVRGERVRLNCEDPPMPATVEEFEARRKSLGPGE